MNKKKIKQYALGHVDAYTYELAQEIFIDYGAHRFSKDTIARANAEAKRLGKLGLKKSSTSDLDYGSVVNNLTYKAKSIAEMKKIFAKCCAKNSDQYIEKMQVFYDAMLKVIEHTNDLKYSAEYNDAWKVKEHCGTEDRGWWRVLEAIKGGSYFCAYDLCRDMLMAEIFYDSGAITESEYRAHIIRRTLKMMANKRFANEKGLPDYDALTTYLDPQYNEKYLDMNLVNAVKEVAS